MPRIVEYKTVYDDKYNQVGMDGQVNKLLREGWVLYGYPTFLTVNGLLQRCQALVRFDEKQAYCERG